MRANTRNVKRKDDALGFNRLSGMVLEASESEDIVEAFKEWEVHGLVAPDLSYDLLADYDPKQDRCLCGQSGVMNKHCLRNKITGEYLWPVGSSCIDRFGDKELRLSAATWGSLKGIRSRVLNGEVASIGFGAFTQRDLRLLSELHVITPMEFQVLFAKCFWRKKTRPWWDGVPFLFSTGPSSTLVIEGLDWLHEIAPTVDRVGKEALAKPLDPSYWDWDHMKWAAQRRARREALDEAYDAIAEQCRRNCLTRIISRLDLEVEPDRLQPLASVVAASSDPGLRVKHQKVADLAADARRIAEWAREKLAAGHGQREVLEMSLRAYG